MFWAILRGHVPAVQRAERGGAGHRLAVPGLPGGAPPQVHPQPAPAPRLPAAVVQHRRRRVDLDPRRLGGGDADRAGPDRRAQDPLPGLEAVPLDDHHDRPRGGPGADRRRRRLLFPARLGLHRPPHPGRRPAAPVRDDGDRDLADAAARVPRARRRHDARQRPHLEALVRPLRAGPPLLPPRPRRRRSLLHAERGGGPPHRRARRRSGPRRRHRQPEVRLARLARRRPARPEPRSRAALLPPVAAAARW